MGKVFKTECPVCGWKKETTGSGAAGGLALHMYKKHGLTMEEWEQQQQLDEEVNYSSDDRKWRFLDPNDQMERLAIDKGFTMISCDEGKEKDEQTLK